ncbi:MAG: hypothetical protein BJ554DRAFT_6780 [Olpidium bornovanus]|uniref:RRM domain-containing protein n=1 Tax=Olpidium bornovanus TaxID=278681 RepID=A0A8H8A2K2_9FUNG|nr:MAG: hypothetical protein BJ554DRAFT_6780 [Olpidium bornovanus]
MKASVMYDPHTRESRGFGFIDFATVEDAQNAVQNADSVILHGRRVRAEMVSRRQAVRLPAASPRPSASEALRFFVRRWQRARFILLTPAGRLCLVRRRRGAVVPALRRLDATMALNPSTARDTVGFIEISPVNLFPALRGDCPDVIRVLNDDDARVAVWQKLPPTTTLAVPRIPATPAAAASRPRLPVRATSSATPTTTATTTTSGPAATTGTRRRPANTTAAPLLLLRTLTGAGDASVLSLPESTDICAPAL